MAGPILLVSLRLLQGLALGGEYGGAATYVAEHSRQTERRSTTSYIQTTATLGMFLALLVISFGPVLHGRKERSPNGERVPSLVSLILVVFSV